VTALERIVGTSLRDEARRIIRAGIISGEIERDRIYSAGSFAERLGVSVTPVREALLDLANAGLVAPVRNRGFRIVIPSDRDLDEIVELRLLVEVPSTRVVVARAGDAELAALEEPVREIEQAALAGDLPAFLLHDRRFHLGLLEITGNRRLVKLVGELRDQTWLVGLTPLVKRGRLRDSAAEHRRILEAIQARDAELAERLMLAHLRHTRGIWAGRGEAAPLLNGDAV
jgi:DNA-binding GntR family transcriptional regulator